ncbi:MAG: amidohydrolase family protein [Bacteroidota bacterium]
MKKKISLDVEYFEGVICPGFVNTHCHLELSYLKSKMPKGEGLDEFLRRVEEVRRKISIEEIEDALIKAENEMIQNGIVAVGDISNSDYSFAQKAKQQLKYYTFIEVLGFHPDRAEWEFKKGKQLQSSIINHRSSITPHSPYSASEKLLYLINEYNSHSNEILTVHNQESEDENLLFRENSGKIQERLKTWGIDTSFFQPSEKNSLQYVLSRLYNAKKIQLVHNTYTDRENIRWAKQFFFLNNEQRTMNNKLFWCFCPNSNLYIEKKLPDIPMFLEEELTITIGTDSLASNDSLSVFDEIKTISKYFPQIAFESVITWATKNGAEFLGMEKEIGTIEKGKKPGLNLLQKINREQMKFSEDTSLRKLI